MSTLSKSSYCKQACSHVDAFSTLLQCPTIAFSIHASFAPRCGSMCGCIARNPRANIHIVSACASTPSSIATLRKSFAAFILACNATTFDCRTLLPLLRCSEEECYSFAYVSVDLLKASLTASSNRRSFVFLSDFGITRRCFTPSHKSKRR